MLSSKRGASYKKLYCALQCENAKDSWRQFRNPKQSYRIICARQHLVDFSTLNSSHEPKTFDLARAE